MQRRKLGSTGFEVAPLAFGGNVFGWTADEPTSFRLLDAFVAAGGNLIDTADSYSRWVPGHREANPKPSSAAGSRSAEARRRGHRDQGRLRHGVGVPVPARGLHHAGGRGSLRRLGVDAIDLYQSHWDDDKTPFDRR
jgi:aryl-alcohol dehydrogenase-like predicted oxidoreductase